VNRGPKEVQNVRHAIYSSEPLMYKGVLIEEIAANQDSVSRYYVI
jgi:hypothetical protein